MKNLNEELSKLGEQLTKLIKANISNVHKDEIKEVCLKIKKIRDRIKNEKEHS